VPHSIFEGAGGSDRSPNRLVIRLQPQESITLTILAKKPGETMRLAPVNLALDLAGSFKEKPVDAYERLIMDVVKGNLTLFSCAGTSWMRRGAGSIRSARVGRGTTSGYKSYVAGSWGPQPRAR